MPDHIRLKSQEVFGMAELYDTWTDTDGNELRTCAIITTEANELKAPIHNRMPVIIRPEDEALWLDARVTDPERVQPLLVPCAAGEMEAYPVSTAVNRPANDSEAVLRSAVAVLTAYERLVRAGVLLLLTRSKGTRGEHLGGGRPSGRWRCQRVVPDVVNVRTGDTRSSLRR